MSKTSPSPTPKAERNFEGQTYEEWYQALDQLCEDRTGLSLNDLPDKNFRSMFDSGLAADEAIDDVLEDEDI